MDGDSGHRWLREVFARAAAVRAPDVHAGAQTRVGEKESGKGKKGRETA